MGNERAGFNLDNDDSLDLAAFKDDVNRNDRPRAQADPLVIQAVAENSGFVSREPHQKQRRRKRTSPYTQQLGLKVRPGMRDLFQALGDELGMYDHTTFETALLALIEKTNNDALLKQYNELVNMGRIKN